MTMYSLDNRQWRPPYLSVDYRHEPHVDRPGEGFALASPPFESEAEALGWQLENPPAQGACRHLIDGDEARQFLAEMDAVEERFA